MPSVETRPYLTPPEDVGATEPWMREIEGLPEPLPSELKDWDAGQDIVLKRLVHVDVARLCKAAGLSNDAEVSLVVSWRSSPGSGQRGCALRRKLERNEGPAAIGLEVRLPGFDLAGALRIFTRVVLSALGSSDDLLSARRIGSILWEDETVVMLEGLGSRFPMEIVDFMHMGFPPSASWRLVWQRDRLHAQAMGCLCLLLNRRHPRVVAAATKSLPDAESRVIWSAIHMGVARELITGALDDEGFVENPAQFDPGTVGDVARTLLERAFPKESPKAVAERLSTKPDLFECQLQAGFNLFDPAVAP